MKKQTVFIHLIALVVCFFLTVGFNTSRAGTINVANLNDSGAGSLRQAISDAIPGQTIEFDATLSGGTITLNNPLIISKDLTIHGNIPITVSGNHAVRVFWVIAGSVTFDSLSIVNGYVAGDSGGGIWVSGATTNVTVTHSTITGNSADSGGGIYVWFATVTVTDSTISGNSADFGGGIFSYTANGSCTDAPNTIIHNSTISGNTAGYFGGGISNENGVMQITDSTIAGNRAFSAGGGVYSYNNDSRTCTRVGDSIITNNTNNDVSAGDITQRFYSLNYNLIGTAGQYVDFNQEFNQDHDQQGVSDAKLNALADNGGPTFTHALQTDSPALNAGSACTGTDQRGITRPQGPACDIGAFELEYHTVSPVAGEHGSISQSTPQSVPRGASIGFTVTADTGYSIASVSGCNGSLVGNIYTTGAIMGDCTVTAGFSINSYTVTPQAGAHGAMNPAIAQTVNYGATAGFTVTPANGYVIESVSGCNGNLLGNIYTTGAITGDCTVTATFRVPTTITVTNLNDSGAGSLRQAIADAGIGAGTGDTIEFDAALSGGTITLSSQLGISKDLTIHGNAPITVSGNHAVRVFNVSAGTVSFDSLSIVNGSASGDNGGGILVSGATANVTVTHSTITDNSADFGGGICVWFATLTVTDSTISGNFADYGGGIYSYTANGSCTDAPNTIIHNSTISGNTADSGGGIFNIGGLTQITDSTIAYNSALSSYGGGVSSSNFSGACTRVGDSIITHNSFDDVSAWDTTQRFYSLNYNLIGTAGQYVDFTQEFNQANDHTAVSDAKLNALADNGGPTFTHALQTDSPALNAGGACTGTDQRGITRPQGPACDIGAFELEYHKVTPVAGAHGSLTPSILQIVPRGATSSFTVTTDTGYSIASVSGCNGTLNGNTYTTGAITADCTVTASFNINSYIVTPQAGAHGSINPATVQTVNYGLTSSFTVTPETGYLIASVSGCNGALVGNTYTTGAITGDCTVIASFGINSYTVTPQAGAHGSINPATAQTVNYGAITSFTVTPETGYSIASVSGCNGALVGNTYTTGAITADCTVTANFGINSYTVTPQAGAHGSINPATAQTVNYGAITSFTVTPETGYSIASVSGCNGALVGNTYTTGAITADCTVTASFSINSYTVTPQAGAHGSINPATAQTVNYGEITSFTVTPETGYSIASVSGCNGALVGNIYTTGAITDDCTVSANFGINSYTVTPQAGAHGAMNPAAPQTVNYGATTGFTVTPETGYSIASVSGCNGALVGNIYTTGAITADCTVTAGFSINSYTVTPQAGAHGAMNPAAPQTVNYGAITSFTVKPEPGYIIASVSGCGGILISNTYTTGAITGDCTIRASFSLWKAAAAGRFHTVAIKADGSLWAWGNNAKGQLGDGTKISHITPVQIGMDTGWQTVATGQSHTVAIKNDGSLWAWGDNSKGQLGDNSKNKQYAPVQIGTDTDWQTVAAGQSHTVAIKADGSLWAFGNNAKGQLGDGTKKSKLSPVQIGADTDWQTVAAGQAHTLAIKTDGSLWAFGNNAKGQLGDGTKKQKSSPVQIGIDKDWHTIAAGQSHTVAIKTDGSLWTFGDNAKGQLGDGTKKPKLTPVQIGEDTDWQVPAAGQFHSLVIKTDGSLWAFGDNVKGQLGDNSKIRRNAPVQIGADTGWQAVAAGQAHTLATKNDGGLWAFGNNTKGQLGDGTKTPRLTPVQIGTDTDWKILEDNISIWGFGNDANGLPGECTKADGKESIQTVETGQWQGVVAGGGRLRVIKKREYFWWLLGWPPGGQLGDAEPSLAKMLLC